jgi:hypothetical protein
VQFPRCQCNGRKRSTLVRIEANAKAIVAGGESLPRRPAKAEAPKVQAAPMPRRIVEAGEMIKARRREPPGFKATAAWPGVFAGYTRQNGEVP